MLQISWSMLKLWEDCHHHALRRMQGKTPKTQDVRIFLPGTVADRVMRAWLEQEDPRPGQMVEMVPEYFKRYSTDKAQGVVRWRGPNDRAVTQNFVRDVVANLEPILYKYVLPFEYHPELKFETTISIPYLDGNHTRVRLVGGIDIAVHEGSNIFGLYDLKATANPQYVRTTLGQSVFYDLAFSKWSGYKPQKFAFFLPACKQKVVWVEISDQARAEMLSRIIKMCHGMWKKDFAPKEGNSGCSICEVKHVCDKFATDIIDDGRKKRISLAGAQPVPAR